MTGPPPLELIAAFVAFARSPNMRQAADYLGLTQPALSKRLQRLEALLPERAFASQGRRKILTPYGRRLFERLDAKIGDLGAIIGQVTSEFGDATHARVRVAARREVLDRVSPRLAFKGSLIFIEASSGKIATLLLRGAIDVGITQNVPDSHELIAKKLFRDSFSLAVPRRLAGGATRLTGALMAKLASEPCLAYRENDEILSQACSLHGVDPSRLNLVRATANYTSLAKMCDSGLGWAVLPEWLRTNGRAVARISLGPSMPARQFSIVFRKELSSVDWFARLLSEIAACFAVSN